MIYVHLLCMLAMIDTHEEQFYNDYFLRLPGEAEFLNVATFQTQAVAYFAWTGGERRPEPPLKEALQICELPLDMLHAHSVVTDCPGFLLSAFRLCADSDHRKFGGLREEARRIFDTQLSPMQREIATFGWLYE